MTLKVYLAGPDVFRPNPASVSEALKASCRAMGFEPLYPMDNQVPPGTENLSRYINDANIAMIRAADFVVANLNPFRGPEPDSGTVFEIGFARGLGKPVFGYINSAETMLARVQRMQHLAPDALDDSQGWDIENFGHPLNLMLVHGVTELVIGSLEHALSAAKRHLAT